MGNGASGLNEIPERLSYEDVQELFKRVDAKHIPNKLYFSLWKDKEQLISRNQALLLLENKLPMITSLNPMVV